MKNACKEQRKYIFWMLVCAELFMSFSFLGYIHIEPISVTLVYIPVLAAGCILGPREAAAMGVVFGLASMWKASAFYVGAGDMIFSPVMSGKPLQSIVLSVVSRGLFGWIAGLLYSAVKRGRHPAVGVILVSSVGRTLHTVLVYGFMGLLFPETGFRVASAFSGMLSWDFIPFLVVCDGLVYLCFRLWDSAYVRTLFFRIISRGKKGFLVIEVFAGISMFC